MLRLVHSEKIQLLLKKVVTAELISIMLAILSHVVMHRALFASEGMPLLLKPCVEGAGNQTYRLTVVPPYVNPAAVKTGKGFCLDIVGVPAGKARAGASVEATPCGSNQMNQRANQYWAIKNNNLASLQVMDTPYCFGISQASPGMLTDCSSGDAHFTVGFQGNNAGALIHTDTGLCVTASGIPPPLPGPPPPRPPSPPNTPCSTPAPAPPSAFSQMLCCRITRL